jgi:ParB-like chromosome segregation protein Spo0J
MNSVFAPTISNTIRLLSLPDAIKDALVAGVISEGHVRPLISLGDPKLMLELFKKILRENATVRQTEELARKIKSEQDRENATGDKKRAQLYVPEQDAMADELMKRYEAHKVQFFQSGKEARVTFVFRGEIGETTQKLKQLHDILAA